MDPLLNSKFVFYYDSNERSIYRHLVRPEDLESYNRGDATGARVNSETYSRVISFNDVLVESGRTREDLKEAIFNGDPGEGVIIIFRDSDAFGPLSKIKELDEGLRSYDEFIALDNPLVEDKNHRISG